MHKKEKGEECNKDTKYIQTLQSSEIKEETENVKLIKVNSIVRTSSKGW